MSYRIMTIAETLNRLNHDLFIPAIQRPYVWTSEQITRLFDSVMRGYPIGALLFWDLPEGSREDWEVYRFVSDFRMGSIHNDLAELAPEHPVTLVLDGQQRLTSLFLGLAGSYTVKQKHKRKVADDAWDQTLLYIDLAHSPQTSRAEEEDDSSPVAEHYRFAFFTTERPPQNKTNELWFQVGLIMDAPDATSRDHLLNTWVQASLQLDSAHCGVAAANLGRLWTALWQDQTVAYFTEAGDSYDRVLDIFIRANDGGTRLSRSDLLMSVITLRWEQFNAREETERLMEDLTEELAPKRAITREFVLRTALFLNDLDFTIKVRNFVPRNIRLLERTWERTKQVLRFAARFLGEHGFHGDRLTSINVLMLVTYYLHKANPDEEAELHLGREDAERIRRWLILLSFRGLLSLQTNNTFGVYRGVIKRSLRDNLLFPAQAIAEIFSNMGRPMEFDDDAVGTWCNSTLDQGNGEALLSLLYDDDLANLRRRAMPLVKAEYFSPDELRRAGVSHALAPLVQGFSDKLVLSVALDSAEQVHYYAMAFEVWAQTLSPAFMDKHCLPQDISLYRLDRLPDWVSARRKLVREKLFGLLREGMGMRSTRSTAGELQSAVGHATGDALPTYIYQDQKCTSLP